MPTVYYTQIFSVGSLTLLFIFYLATRKNGNICFYYILYTVVIILIRALKNIFISKKVRWLSQTLLAGLNQAMLLKAVILILPYNNMIKYRYADYLAALTKGLGKFYVFFTWRRIT